MHHFGITSSILKGYLMFSVYNICRFLLCVYETGKLQLFSAWADEGGVMNPKVVSEREQADAKAAREQVQLKEAPVVWSLLWLPAKIQSILRKIPTSFDFIGSTLIAMDIPIEIWDLNSRIDKIQGDRLVWIS